MVSGPSVTLHPELLSLRALLRSPGDLLGSGAVDRRGAGEGERRNLPSFVRHCLPQPAHSDEIGYNKQQLPSDWSFSSLLKSYDL